MTTQEGLYKETIKEISTEEDAVCTEGRGQTEIEGCAEIVTFSASKHTCRGFSIATATCRKMAARYLYTTGK